ncbi:MAG TPA: lysylphosphatidylglycerol synthase transmembrane domain-containing protein [Candidatus Binatia bacterium]|nr:lysylphosphatidylglycerol synthase transmembrane domain-containing protein [Candidatus Binatia bacterium]
MPSPRRLVKILVGLTVSAGLLVYLFWNTDLAAIAARLRETSWGWLLASIALGYGSLWSRARRWFYLFPPGSRPSHLFNAVMILYMGNNLLPLRAGEVLRVFVVVRRGQPVWTTVATVVVERLLDGLAICLMLAGMFLVLPVPRQVRWGAVVLLPVLVALVVVVALVAVVPEAGRGLVRTLFLWASGLPGSERRRRLENRALDIVDTVHQGLEAIRTPASALPIAFWSAAVWTLIAFSVWVALWSAHLFLPLSAAWTLIAVLGLGVSVPSSPGFVGVIQAATVVALSLYGVSRTDALSFSLLLHASQFIPVTVHGLILLAVEHVSLTDAARPAPALTRPGHGPPAP